MFAKKQYIGFYIFIMISLFSSGVMADSFGYDNPNLPSLREELFDGKPSSFYMPNNKSVFGNFSFNGGWENDGLSIIDGDIYAQTGFFLNITSLNVTKQNLTVNENLIVIGNITADSFIGTHFGNSSIWSKAGSNVFTTTLTDFVGIGTDSPSSPLHVIGTNSAEGIRIQRSGVTSQYLSLSEDDGGRHLIEGFGTKEIVIRNNEDVPIHFETNGTNKRMTILGSGNVGIGITNPGQLLSVAGAASIQGNLFTNEIRSFTGGQLTINAPATGIRFLMSNTGAFYSWNDVSNQVLMYINEDGNVGINTSTPQNLLNLVGGDINITNNSVVDIFSLDFTNGDQILGNSSLIISTGDNKTIRMLIGITPEQVEEQKSNLRGVIPDNRSTVLLGDFDNIANVNDFSRYKETNLNNGSFAVAGYQSENNLNHTMNIGITSSNFEIGGMFLPNEGVTFSLAPNGTTFSNFRFQSFDWFVNRDDSVVSFDFQRIASLSPQGHFNITGNLNVSGNILGNDIYGYAKMKNVSGVVIDLITVGVFENITGINNGSKLNGVSYDGDHKFTIQKSGTYEVSASVSFVGASATDYSFDIFVNGVAQDIFAMRQITTPNAEGSISLGAYPIDVVEGDFVTLGIKDGATPTDPTIISVQFGLRRIGD